MPFLDVGSLTGQLYLNWHFDQLFPRTPPATVSLESVAMIVQEPHAFNRPNNPRANTAPVIAPVRVHSPYPRSPQCPSAFVANPPQLFGLARAFDFQLSTVDRYFRPKSSIFNKLQTLCRFQKTQLLCHQANTNSSTETPGVGGMQRWPLTQQHLHRCRMDRA